MPGRATFISKEQDPTDVSGVIICLLMKLHGPKCLQEKFLKSWAGSKN